MTCEECKSNQSVIISQYAYERERTKDELTVKRLYRIIVALIVGWALTIGTFVWFISRYSFESYEAIIEAEDGIANYIGNDGDISNGTYNGTEEVDDAQE